MTPNGGSNTDRPKKLQRISQACDLCHRRSIRCRPSNENAEHQCQNCFDFAVECTYNRPSRRRRNPANIPPGPPNALPSQQQYFSVRPLLVISIGRDVYRAGADFVTSDDHLK
jgi:hypothetical protein